MSTHDLSGEGVAARLEPVARRALAEYGVSPDAALTLLNVSENATYAVDDPDTGERTVLRVHRHGYHDAAAIESELAWLDALREDTGVRTPRVLPTPDGRRLLAMPEEGQADPRHVVRFEFLPGVEPEEAGETLPESFEVLGGITARMHEHALRWQRPPGFTRFAWDYDGAFGSVARWGRWQDGMAVGPAETEVLGRLDDTLRARLTAFGSGPDRYGLVHADLRLANLLEDRTPDGDEHYVIDFDDCGFSWFLYDFGSAVSFFEDDPRVPELADAWVRGYRTVRDLPAEDEAEIPTFVMMRRLLLVAWIGSHSGTELAQSMGAAFTAASCDLAEDYLSRFG
ncbi:phosphotransferase [Nocardioides agariphilus]|uniref:Phosphotransferase n=1 Tax=Nocardioides agariphilus TaxID=433664 RepID=A0A930YH75_9ACTN|nr:phosphotransferase [Nocardioides agariphilus]